MFGIRAIRSAAATAATAMSVFSPFVAEAYYSPRAVAVEASGSLVVVDLDAEAYDDAVYRVDPLTGNRTVVSGVGRGAGPAFTGPSAIAVEASGDLVVADLDDGFYRVDPITGDRTIAHGGTSPHHLTGIVAETSGDLVWSDDNRDAVVRMSPGMTPVIVSDASTGAGPTFVHPTGIAVEASDDLVVVDRGLDAVVRVDPVTGDRTIVSDPGTGAGPSLVEPHSIAVEPSGDLVVIDLDLNAVIRVDPVTGDRAILSDAGTGTGPTFVSPIDIAVNTSGDLMVVDRALDAVIRVDPVTGDRVRLGIGCPSAPNPSCTAGFERGRLIVIERRVGREKLVAKLALGPTILQADLGNPTEFAGAAFAVCLYDDADVRVANLIVDHAGERCTPIARCWRSLGRDPPMGRGYAYKDASAHNFGVRKMTFKGGDVRKSKLAIIAGNGPSTLQTSLPTGIAAALSSTSSVQVQVINDQGACYGTTLTDIRRQDGTLFKAK